MRQFSFDDDDEYQEEQHIEASFQFIPSEEVEIFQMVQANLIERDIKQKLLFEVILMLEKTPFWKWKSKAKRYKIIQETYKYFDEMLENEDG